MGHLVNVTKQSSEETTWLPKISRSCLPDPTSANAMFFQTFQSRVVWQEDQMLPAFTCLEYILCIYLYIYIYIYTYTYYKTHQQEPNKKKNWIAHATDLGLRLVDWLVCRNKVGTSRAREKMESILGMFLKQKHTTDLLEIVVLPWEPWVDEENKSIMETHDLFKLHIK